MKRVLVAGATGYLGRHLVAELKRREYWVRVLVRHATQADSLPAADDVFVGQVTSPGSIAGVATGVDTVLSAIGITKPSDRLRYAQVDYGGNLALLREAEKSGVERFGYVALFDGERLRDSVRMVAAKERFVDALLDSAVPATVIRPTGFFSDMRAFLDMANKGRCVLVGSGDRRINPISGHDLADAFVDAIERGTPTLDVGGPEVLAHRDVARLAAAVAGRRERVIHVPPGLVKVGVRSLRAISPEWVWGPVEFLATVLTTDMVAPLYGADRLEDFFRREQANRPG